MRGVQICYLGVNTLVPRVHMPLFPCMARYELEFRRNDVMCVGRGLMWHVASKRSAVYTRSFTQRCTHRMPRFGAVAGHIRMCAGIVGVGDRTAG
jgi:hypothetical protein